MNTTVEDLRIYNPIFDDFMNILGYAYEICPGNIPVHNHKSMLGIHGRRTMFFAEIMSKELNISDRSDVLVAAFLHDIGKLFTSDRYLHTRLAANLLDACGFSKNIVKMVNSHMRCSPPDPITDGEKIVSMANALATDENIMVV